VDVDAAVRNGSRLLTLFALLAFLAWIGTLQHLLFFAALAFGGGAYALFLVDHKRHRMEIAAGGTGAEDRSLAGSEEPVSPGVSAGGIHLTFETRTRWRGKR